MLGGHLAYQMLEQSFAVSPAILGFTTREPYFLLLLD